ncbi:MAG: MBL fold metallo-hydrolase [Bacteroidetes bacterium]|nr:MBL fold metallo-hydrolase [Bacteroidota bacterium]
MEFGSWKVNLLETGRFKLDGGAMFGVIPKPLWHRANPADERNRIDMTMRALCLRRADRVILVDTGVGHKESGKFRDIFAIDFSVVSLETGLATLGITAEEVTDVILTHLHFDHVGGCVRNDGGALSAMFPNATHYVQRRQWEWAMTQSERDRASFIADNYLPLREAGILQLLDGEEKIFEEMELHIVDGHTFGQQLVRVRDGDVSLLYAADLIPMSAHLPGPWIMGYDLQPLVTLQEKHDLLTRAVGDGDILMFEHDPIVEAATVERSEKGFRLAHHGTLDDVYSQHVRSG